MIDHQPIVEAERALNLGLATFGWVFVLVESLSKRVDVPALKAKLDVRDAQVMAAVVKEIENAVLPYLGAPLSNFTIDEVEDTEPEGDDAEDDEYMPTALGEGAKDALVKSLRKSEASLHLIYTMRRLPLSILRLNGRVFWCIFVVAVLASVGAFLDFVLGSTPFWLEVALTAVPLAGAAIAIGHAVMRHLKVQSAEENIIDTNSYV
jgi:hypothetical protein